MGKMWVDHGKNEKQMDWTWMSIGISLWEMLGTWGIQHDLTIKDGTCLLLICSLLVESIELAHDHWTKVRGVSGDRGKPGFIPGGSMYWGLDDGDMGIYHLRNRLGRIVIGYDGVNRWLWNVVWKSWIRNWGMINRWRGDYLKWLQAEETRDMIWLVIFVGSRTKTGFLGSWWIPNIYIYTYTYIFDNYHVNVVFPGQCGLSHIERNQ